VDAILDAHAGVTGLLNLGSNRAAPDYVEGLLRAANLPPLSALPTRVFAMGVTALCLKCNELGSLEGLQALVCLKSLDLSENNFEALEGHVLAALVNLVDLDVSENKLASLPDEIGSLAKLESLSAFKNVLKAVPDTIGGCVSLRECNFFNNLLIKLPKSISDCKKLEVLNIGGNKLKTIPATDQWTQMRELKVQQNGLIMLPSFAPMAALVSLKLDFNKSLEKLPDFGDHYPDLEHVDVGNCNIDTLPASMAHWPALKTLNCSNNKILELPPLRQTTLEIFNCSSNQIKMLPIEMAQCSGMKTFFFSGSVLLKTPFMSERRRAHARAARGVRPRRRLIRRNHITVIQDEFVILAEAPNFSRMNVGGQKTPGAHPRAGKRPRAVDFAI
jgi:Leucine-rich repeat (LRR) protein